MNSINRKTLFLCICLVIVVNLVLCTACTSNTQLDENRVDEYNFNILDDTDYENDFYLVANSVYDKELCLAYSEGDWSYDYDVCIIQAKFNRENADCPLKWELSVSDRASSEQMEWYNNGIEDGSLVWSDSYTLEDYLFLTVESNTLCTITCEQPFGCEFMVQCSLVADPSISGCVYVNFNRKIISASYSVDSDDPNQNYNGLNVCNISTSPYTYTFVPQFDYNSIYTLDEDVDYEIYFEWNNSDQNAYEYLYNYCSSNDLGVYVNSRIGYGYYIESFSLDVDFLCYLMFLDAFIDPLNNIDYCTDAELAKDKMRSCVESALDAIGELSGKVNFINYYIRIGDIYYGPYVYTLGDVEYE